MRTLLLSFLYFFLQLIPNSTHADWIFYGKNTRNDQYWYENQDIKKSNESVWVWTRTRYGEAKERGVKSNKLRLKINCEDYSFEVISRTNYLDENWENEKVYYSVAVSDKVIYPNSVFELLANIVCKNNRH